MFPIQNFLSLSLLALFTHAISTLVSTPSLPTLSQIFSYVYPFITKYPHTYLLLLPLPYIPPFCPPAKRKRPNNNHNIPITIPIPLLTSTRRHSTTPGFGFGLGYNLPQPNLLLFINYLSIPLSSSSPSSLPYFSIFPPKAHSLTQRLRLTHLFLFLCSFFCPPFILFSQVLSTLVSTSTRQSSSCLFSSL